MEKRDFHDETPALAAVARVTFLPDGNEIEVPVGTSLLEAARQAEIHLNASCNGRGACGKCKLIVERGTVNTQTTTLLTEREKAANYVLACQATVTEDITVRIPPEAIERQLKVAGMGEEVTSKLLGRVTEIDPMVVEVSLELAVPTLDDPVSDLDRLYRGLRKAGVETHRMSLGLKVMRELAAAMRDENWKVTASIMRRRHIDELIEVAPGNGTGPSLGLAIDVGTTTIVVYLVDMADGRVLAATSGHNRQAACGDDVINRIVCAEKDGVRKLSRMALATINSLIEEAAAAAGAERDRIKNVAIAGNTTMIHLLLGIEPRYIRREPYLPTVSEFPVIKAGEVGLKTHPGAAVFVFPGPASYVGGDIVSGMIYSGQHREAPMTLFIDIGTNGEIVLGNNELLLTASCSAGPAFEGARISHGMGGSRGAIEKVIVDGRLRTNVIGNVPPVGLCGSALIDLAAELKAEHGVSCRCIELDL
ncbi:MAG: ferredoxin, partial [Deltaproteobacteria bacterium]